MVDANSIIECFGDSLVRVTLPRVVDSACFAAARTFLSEVGLPRFDPLLLTPRRRATSVVVDDAHYMAIASDEGTLLGLDDRCHLISFDPSGDLPARFVNSSVALFAESLLRYAQALPARREADDDEAVALCDDLRSTLQTIDPAALADPDHWWPVVIEQVTHGLM